MKIFYTLLITSAIFYPVAIVVTLATGNYPDSFFLLISGLISGFFLMKIYESIQQTERLSPPVEPKLSIDKEEHSWPTSGWRIESHELLAAYLRLTPEERAKFKKAFPRVEAKSTDNNSKQSNKG